MKEGELGLLVPCLLELRIPERVKKPSISQLVTTSNNFQMTFKSIEREGWFLCWLTNRRFDNYCHLKQVEHDLEKQIIDDSISFNIY